MGEVVCNIVRKVVGSSVIRNSCRWLREVVCNIVCKIVVGNASANSVSKVACNIACKAEGVVLEGIA